jgi:hypothetical protein
MPGLSKPNFIHVKLFTLLMVIRDSPYSLSGQCSQSHKSVDLLTYFHIPKLKFVVIKKFMNSQLLSNTSTISQDILINIAKKNKIRNHFVKLFGNEITKVN